MHRVLYLAVMKNDIIKVRVVKELKEKFVKYAESQNKTMSEILRDFIKNKVKGVKKNDKCFSK